MNRFASCCSPLALFAAVSATACGGAFEPASIGGGGAGGARSHATGGNAASTGHASTATTGAGGSAATTAASSSTGAGGEAGGGGAAGKGGVVSPCTVIVADQGHNVITGADVVVNDAAGAVFAVAKTGAAGSVVVQVPAGGIVSVFDAQPLTSTVSAAVAPPAGATFAVVVTRPQPPPPPPATPTTYNVVPTAFPGGVAKVRFLSSCGSITITIGAMVAAVPGGCSGAVTETLWAVALDASGTPRSYGNLTEATNPGKSVNLNLPVNLTSFQTMSDEVADIPAGFDAQLTAMPWRGAVGIDAIGGASSANPGTLLAYTYLVPPGLADHFVVTEGSGTASALASSRVVRTRTYQTLPASEALPVHVMPLVSAAPLDVSDFTHPRATWSVDPGPLGDAAQVSIHLLDGATTTSYSVYLPASHAAAFTLPDVPDALSSYRPQATSKVTGWAIQYIDLETTDLYGDVLGNSAPQVDGMGTVTTTGSYLP